MKPDELPFREVILYDFEFAAPPGERPRPVCLVYWELRSGIERRVWRDELLAMSSPPFDVGDDVLVIAYYASAEVGCHLALGWQPPVCLLDLFTEFRNQTNGLSLPCGNGLLGAAAYFGIPTMSAEDKDGLRELAQQGSWTEDERRALLDYCAEDVEVLARVLPHILAPMTMADLGRALLRGRYMAAAARIEFNGVPIDVAALAELQAGWDVIKHRLIEEVDRDYGVYNGTSFSIARFERWLTVHDIPWPRTARGQVCLDDDTFKEIAKSHPELEPLRQLRHALGQLRLNDLAVGADGRNRTLLSAFRAATGRNQPSNTKFIFGPAVWLRSLMRPEPGHGLAYADFSQQEFAIAACLSGDANMLAAYVSGDPYLSFAVQAGAVPPTATKSSHREVREKFKVCALGVLYGMGANALAAKLGGDTSEAAYLLELHRRTFPRYWRWSANAVDRAVLTGSTSTVFGWTVRVGPKTTPTSLMNFPMQATGAEILRLACIVMTEIGIEVCAPVHDAVVIHARLEDIDEHVEVAQDVMAWASAVVLGGLRLRSDTKTVRYPDRYEDERGRAMWDRVWRLLRQDAQLRSAGTGAPSHCAPVHAHRA